MDPSLRWDDGIGLLRAVLLRGAFFLAPSRGAGSRRSPDGRGLSVVGLRADDEAAVVPAQAGTHLDPAVVLIGVRRLTRRRNVKSKMDPSLRWDDEVELCRWLWVCAWVMRRRWVPAFAVMTSGRSAVGCGRDDEAAVVPAKAGTHLDPAVVLIGACCPQAHRRRNVKSKMDPSLRWDDEAEIVSLAVGVRLGHAKALSPAFAVMTSGLSIGCRWMTKPPSSQRRLGPILILRLS